ncbi:hypothetical protein [Cryobacterium sp. TMT4-31]|uniref:hypothetical protein n=1 Tax=Cryobacterium sp. TMT4-31 TaxID=1259259 RepID=UPI00106920B8|nr:hypothetical protein [Cryobacterium sp. TMT4-31]TFC86319.1 hypothetical protein E3T19_15130 [Cryobacterium sp. TMT4-31]
MVKAKSPDVHDGEFSTLNSKFYQGSPHSYFERRLQSLTVALGAEGAINDLLKSGVSYGDFEMNLEDGSNDSVTDGQKEIDDYAAVESVVLLHHTAEATLRLYLAHANRNPCPWLAVAKLMSPREFKQGIQELAGMLQQEDVLDDIAEVFSYRSTPEFLLGKDPTAAWTSHREGLRMLLCEAIRVLLEDAHIYNAAKHGMAVISSDLGFSLGAEQGNESLIEQKGPVLTFLELSHVPETGSMWHQTAAWVDPTKYMGVTFLLIKLMDSLWRSAKAHFEIESAVKLPYLLEANQISDLLGLHLKEGFNVSRMSERLHVAEK